jgi:hypothetical protein
LKVATTFLNAIEMGKSIDVETAEVACKHLSNGDVALWRVETCENVPSRGVGKRMSN